MAEEPWIPSNSRISPVPPTTTTPVRDGNPFQAIIDDEDAPVEFRTITPPSPDIELVSINGSINSDVTITFVNSTNNPARTSNSNRSNRTSNPTSAVDDPFDIDFVTMPTATSETTNYLDGLSTAPMQNPSYLSIHCLRHLVANKLARTAYGTNRSGMSVIAEDKAQ